MRALVQDLLDALRHLRRRPSESVLVVAILTLGLAAAIAVFTYVNEYTHPFPGVDPERFVRLFEVRPEEPYGELSFLDYEDYSAVDQFEGLAAVQPYFAASVRRESRTEVAFLEAVSGGFFELARVEMHLGRGLELADDRREADPAAVISYDWWRRGFGGEQSVMGQTLYLNSRPFTIVGVVAPRFVGTTSDVRPDVWIPIAHFRDRYTSWDRLARDRDQPLVRVYGRLRPSVAVDFGADRLQQVAASLDRAFPSRDEPRRIALGPATWIDPRVRVVERPTTRLMSAAAGGLLLLVCANAGNLLLALASGRSHELAMRSALGATRRRLVRVLLIENVLLAIAAGLVSITLAGPLGSWIGSYFARPSVWGAEVARQASLDLRVLAFAVMAAAGAGLLAGLFPARRAARSDLVSALSSHGAGAPRAATRWSGRTLLGVSDLLVAAQIALAVVLLVLGGLVLRTLSSVSRTDPGFEVDHLIASHVSTSSTTLQPEERGRFFERLRTELIREPWVRDVAILENALLSPQRSAPFRLDGVDEPVAMLTARALPGSFAALGIDVLDGRDLSSRDSAESPDVVVVNEALARRVFGEARAVGQTLRRLEPDGGERTFEIVGVVRDVRARDLLGGPEPMVFTSYPQHPHPSGSALHVVVNGDPKAASLRLRRWLRELEPHLAIVNVLPYTEVVDGFLYRHRMNAELFTSLAIVGGALAALGIWSVLTLSVARRRYEIGIRMAIGAGGAQIGRLVLARTVTAVGIGAAFGLVMSLGAGSLARALISGVEPDDPLVLTGGLVALFAAAALAAVVPVLRAVRLDPLSVVRDG